MWQTFLPGVSEKKMALGGRPPPLFIGRFLGLTGRLTPKKPTGHGERNSERRRLRPPLAQKAGPPPSKLNRTKKRVRD